MIRRDLKIINLSSHTRWRQMKRMGRDDQIRGLKKLTKVTYKLEKDDKDGIG